MRAVEFEILKDIESNGRRDIPLERKPVRVATMMDFKRFEESGHRLIHNHTVFLEDQHHDWSWNDGKFRYYTRVADRADVLIVYSSSEELPQEKADAYTADVLQNILNTARNNVAPSLGGYGENTVYLSPKMYAALTVAIERFKGKQ